MREYDESDPEYGPDPEIGLWGWNDTTHTQDQIQERPIKTIPPVERIRTASYEFNRYMIDLFNESQKK